MILSKVPFLSLFLLVNINCFLSNSALAQIQIDSLHIVDKQRISRYEFKYTFNVTVSNEGADAFNIAITPNAQTQTTLIQSDPIKLSFIASQSVETLEGGLVFIHDRREAFSDNTITWEITFDAEYSISDTFSTNSSYHTGTYTNFFSKLGIASQQAVSEKLESTYSQLFELIPEGGSSASDDSSTVLYSESFELGLENWETTSDNGSRLEIATNHSGQSVVISPSWETSGDVFSFKNSAFINKDIQNGISVSFDLYIPHAYIEDGNLTTQLLLEDANQQPAFVGYASVSPHPSDTFFTIKFENISSQTSFGYISESFDFSRVQGVGIQFIANGKSVDIKGDIVIDNVKVSTAINAPPFTDNGQSLLFAAGEDMAFIKAIDSNDIRSEGMSYGMFIAVMMDDQETFDKLWKFTKTKIQNKSGPHEHFYAWQLNAKPPYLPIATNPAPDGEEYFAMALFLANNRWGSSEGIFDYKREANKILSDMIYTNSPSTRLMMHPTYKQVEFVTTLNIASFSDPSYHLPAFYDLWAIWSDENNAYWHEAAEISRAYLLKAAHPVTGLYSDYASHEGVPQVTSFNSNSHKSAWDSFRVMGNLALDYNWVSENEELKEVVERQVSFFANEVNTFGDFIAIYEVDGTREPGINYRSHGRTAMNAFGATISDNNFAKEMITDLWEQDAPTGKYRYYDGMLHMLSLLYVSGEYKIYHPR